MAQPLLSIGMIVKNEIRCIEKCLKALRPLREAIPCELVIADTGSTDGTREVAEQYADVLFDFVWVDDFSAARNAVLDRCAGKWSLAVDADEYLDPDFAQLIGFLTGPEADSYLLATVNQYNFFDLDMKGEGADFLALRMARMDVRPRWIGVIHETIPIRDWKQVKSLMNVKLCHDGYARDPKHPERYSQKMERNLDLLDRELERDPQNLRRLLQCVESAGPFPARKVDYARRSMKVLTQRRQTQSEESYGPFLCCKVLNTAVEQRMPELERWRRWAEENYSGHIALRLDGTFFLLKDRMEQRNYEAVPTLAETFLSAWKDYQDRNFDLTLLSYTTLLSARRQFEVYARAAGGEALGRLGRPAEAAALLIGELGWDGLRPADLRVLLVAGTWAAGEESLQDFVAAGAEAVQAMTGENAAGMWDIFCATANTAFQKRDLDEEVPERPWRLFSKVKGGLGQAVRLMEADPSEIQMALDQIRIEDWPEIPVPAVVRAVGLGAELPEAFFTQSRERLAGLTTQISEALDIAPLLEWESRWDFTTSMARFQFLFELLAAALRADKTWEEETEGQLPLCDRFLDVAADYLPNCYNPELLADETEWTALPGLHRFALHLLQGRADKAAGDELGYIRSLRAALKAAPAMKKAVSFLKDTWPTPSISLDVDPELAALAEQVRTILSQFPEDDPAVATLKESDIYKKVAYLIEGTEAPAFGGSQQLEPQRYDQRREQPRRFPVECDGYLGQGAKVMTCTSVAEAAALLNQVEDWETFPPEALLHALGLGARIPVGLCIQRPDVRLKLLATMAQGDPDFAFHMAVYPWQTPETLPLLQTQFDLVTYAIQYIGPLKDADETELCWNLCDKLTEMSQELLPRLYSQEVIVSRENWPVLPNTHQFCLWLQDGSEKRAAGDELGYVRALRAALKANPSMKKAISFLMEDTGLVPSLSTNVDPELLALAEQVKTILAQYQADDPVIVALRESEAYRKVAHLIEVPANQK